MKKMICLAYVSLLLFGSMPVKGSTQCDVDWIPGTTSNFCYKVIEKGRTWQDASAYCRQIGSELASISDENEQNFIASLFSTLPSYVFWIGGTKQTQDGSWQWSDNTPFR
ncbi:snaclec alboaggregin-D subunit beta-like [Ruditapes philippinarum]|uniref:snaclec alboaggregin-D subunit beta-like n=1 Tax=Ruditapes philippinarum TaxID=129788 RepID=UPI00295AD5E2|nr:snaclec alboaggregin-D subunit beta-like [Ruditapes philippinarum]